MIWKDGVPKADGVDDWRDSAVIGGICHLFDLPLKPMMSLYLTEHGRIIRCPGDDPCDTSRDNSIPPIAAAYRSGLIEEYRVTIERTLQTNLFQNGDLLSPAHRGFLKYVLYGKSLSMFEALWLNLDIFFMAKFQPLAEPNQLLCMLKVLDRIYLKRYCYFNPYWRQGIRKYWGSDHKREAGLAEHMILDIERDIL